LIAGQKSAAKVKRWREDILEKNRAARSLKPTSET
jgi:hypothetical protein